MCAGRCRTVQPVRLFNETKTDQVADKRCDAQLSLCVNNRGRNIEWFPITFRPEILKPFACLLTHFENFQTFHFYSLSWLSLTWRGGRCGVWTLMQGSQCSSGPSHNQTAGMKVMKVAEGKTMIHSQLHRSEAVF